MQVSYLNLFVVKTITSKKLFYKDLWKICNNDTKNPSLICYEKFLYINLGIF